jgi:chlorobactene glucosyltransferase
MLYQGIIALCLVIVMINLILNSRALRKLSDKKEKLPEPLPLISILIPARDEESDIAACLESLRRQDYPNFEILVLDDSSSDTTAAVVEQIAAVDPRVRLLRGKPLPQGWAGKPFACYQLASKARGSWLLFTDADTIHAPAMLRSALAYACNNRLTLLSGLPLQRTVSFSQRVVIPVMYFIILSWFPLWWLQGSAKPKPGLTIGQFIFVSAQEYHEIGGHEAVRSRILEDVWLGFEMARHGKPQATVDLSQLVACRMYEDLGDLWEGFTKWTYSVCSLSPWMLGLMMLGGFSLFIAPFLWLAWHFLPVPTAYDSFMLIIIQLVVIMLMRSLVDHRFRYSRLYSLSHPVGISFMLLSGVYAAIKRFIGAGVCWKQRLYTPKSGIE